MKTLTHGVGGPVLERISRPACCQNGPPTSLASLSGCVPPIEPLFAASRRRRLARLAGAALLRGALLAALVGGCSDDKPTNHPDAAITADSQPADRGDSGPEVDLRRADGALADSLPRDTSQTDAGPPPCTAPTNRALRIFFIGNSFTLGGPIPTLVGKLATAAGFPTPEIQYSALGGFTLEWHRTLASSINGINAGGWDYVVLQEYSTRPTDNIGDPPRFKLDASWFYDQTKASSPNARVILYETWARHPDHGFYPQSFKDPAEMQAQLRKHYNDAANTYIPQHATAAVKTDVEVAPAGDAWEAHLATATALRLHASDDYHAGKNGQYLNAIVIFSTIYGCQATGLSSLSLDAADAAKLQASADVVTKKVGVPPGSKKEMAVGAVVQIDFGPTATTAVSGWNNVTSASGSLENAQANDGSPTSVDVRITDNFSGTNTSGVAANTLGWPATVSQDTLWAGAFAGHHQALTAPGKLTLRDLPAGTYNLEIFASRAGKDGQRDRLGRYTVNGAPAQDLDATDNAAKTLTFANLLVGKSGELELEVAVSPAGTARFAYLNALILTRLQ